MVICEYCKEIKTLLPKVLSELSAKKGRIAILQTGIKRIKLKVVNDTDSAVNTQYETSLGIQMLLKHCQIQLRKKDVSTEIKDMKVKWQN